MRFYQEEVDNRFISSEKSRGKCVGRQPTWKELHSARQEEDQSRLKYMDLVESIISFFFLL